MNSESDFFLFCFSAPAPAFGGFGAAPAPAFGAQPGQSKQMPFVKSNAVVWAVFSHPRLLLLKITKHRPQVCLVLPLQHQSPAACLDLLHLVSSHILCSQMWSFSIRLTFHPISTSFWWIWIYNACTGFRSSTTRWVYHLWFFLEGDKSYWIIILMFTWHFTAPATGGLFGAPAAAPTPAAGGLFGAPGTKSTRTVSLSVFHPLLIHV